mmetsp:Transcript_54605/g.132621  ORF Transcript_54605/g.132621 Transcript_54605/m.132621 type:complete len:337 (-) Transcript_54605:211-1221(-)
MELLERNFEDQCKFSTTANTTATSDNNNYEEEEEEEEVASGNTYSPEELQQKIIYTIFRKEIQYAIEKIENEEMTLYYANPRADENGVLYCTTDFTIEPGYIIRDPKRRPTIKDYDELVDDLAEYVKDMTRRQQLAFQCLKCHVKAWKAIDEVDEQKPTRSLIRQLNQEISSLRQKLSERELLDEMLQERLEFEEEQRERIAEESHKLELMESNHWDEIADFDSRVCEGYDEIDLTEETERELLRKLEFDHYGGEDARADLERRVRKAQNEIDFTKEMETELLVELGQVQSKLRDQESKMEKLLEERNKTLVRHKEEEDRQRQVLRDLDKNGNRPR